MRCDFCSGVPITATYSANDFVAYSQPVMGMSEGKWAACRVCEALIDQNKWTDLVERVTTTFFQEYPVLKGVVSREKIEQQFMELYVKLRNAGFKKETM